MSANPFWTFSLALYARPGVSAACLALQDEAGADVNLVLYLLWNAATGRRLDMADIASADAALACWRTDVIAPLRAVRRATKAELLPAAAAFHTSVKALELEAERLAQAALFQRAGAPASAAGDPAILARTYLEHYAAHLARPLPANHTGVLLDALAERCVPSAIHRPGESP